MARQSRDALKYKLMQIMASHAGRQNAISMEQLHEQIFGNSPESKVNSTRKIRRLVEMVRRDGIPICSTPEVDGGGYYLAAAGSELEDYCRRIRNRALKILKMEAQIKKKSLLDIVKEIEMNLGA